MIQLCLTKPMQKQPFSGKHCDSIDLNGAAFRLEFWTGTFGKIYFHVRCSKESLAKNVRA